MDENRLPELPQEAFRPMIAQSVQLEQFLGEELIFCFRDLDGVHTFTTCYGDIYKTVNALRDYIRLLESVCDQWELTGFHRATYEYHAEKLRKIADKLQAGIGYDYDKAVERCKKKRARKSHSNDVGEDALLLTVRAAGKSADNEKEAAPYEEDTPFSTIFLKPILTMLGATETIMPYALTYSRIYILSCVFNVFNVTMNNIVSSEGAAKTTMCALLLGAVLNIGLDPLFIYTFNMGVAGAAIATAISQLVSTLVYLTYILRKRSAFSFSLKAFSPNGQMMAEILKIGVPTLVFQLLTSLSIALINRAASDYGDSVIAGMGAVTRITSMGTLVVFGFLKGFQPIAGFSYGAKKFDRLREAIKTSIIWSTSFCLVVGLVMAAFSTQIISQFTEGDVQMILAGQKSLFANGLTFIFFGFYTVYSSLFLALGKGAAGFFLGSCRQGICFVPVILLLPMVWGMNGILYAQPIADIISVVITLFMAIHLHKEISIAESRTKTIT